MSVIDGIPLLLGGEGYQISRSVRLRSSATANFTRTLSASNRKTWTWSAWVKRGLLANRQALFSAGLISGTFHYHTIHFDSNDKLNVVFYPDTTSTTLITTQVFRDPSAWYHLVVAFDTTQATAANRVKVYVNGSQVTAFDTASYSAQNTDGYINSAAYNSGVHYIGRFTPSDTAYLDGYLTEINFIDGQALTPSSFGETDVLTGVWKPKKYAGTYGTNGFFLNFSDNSSNTATTIGKDYSGNGNNWTPNNISVTAGSTYDSMLDVPTLWADGGNGRGNYCVLNPLSTSQFTVSNANLNWSITSSASNALYLRSTLAVSSGKWYWEVTPTDVGAGPNLFIGIQDANYSPNSSTTDNVTSGFAYKYDGNKVTGATSTAYGSSWTNNDVIGVALDMDAGTITFYKNNTSQGTAFSSLSGTYLPLIMHNVGGTSRTTAGNVNFGQRPFTYTPPTGFKALNTQNLPEPTIKKGNAYFDATTYTGNGGTQTVANSGGFAPDFVWIKNRSTATDHGLFDTVRGATKRLASNLANAETTEVNSLTAFTSTGFTVGATQDFNQNSIGLVGWQWKEGATQGFDIVTYTGDGTSPRNISHSLGVVPAMVIVKSRGSVSSWIVKHKNLSSNNVLFLEGTNAQLSPSNGYVQDLSSSTTFGVVNGGGGVANVNTNGTAYVAYLFSEVAGFSKFGSYTGNGSADGPFVFCGFKPRWVMVKATSGALHWWIWDTGRNTYNAMNDALVPDLTVAEQTPLPIDCLSNGFKLRTSNGEMNNNGTTFIFAAFAENPFKYVLAR